MANSPLQQSAFVFLPEEETVRRRILADPDLYRKAAQNALTSEEQLLRRAGGEIRGALTRCAEACGRIRDEANRFSERLPEGSFGRGNGTELLFPFGRFLGRMQTEEAILRQAGLSLHLLEEPLTFARSNADVIAGVLDDGELSARVVALQSARENLQAFLGEAEERIGRFPDGVLSVFYDRAAVSADVAHNGEEMRFSALRRLCGELGHAADGLERFCRERNQSEMI